MRINDSIKEDAGHVVPFVIENRIAMKNNPFSTIGNCTR